MDNDTQLNTAVNSGDAGASGSSPDKTTPTSSGEAQVAQPNQETVESGERLEQGQAQPQQIEGEHEEGYSQRASKRFQDLANKVRTKSEQVKSLRERLQEVEQKEQQPWDVYKQNPEFGALGGPPGPGETRELTWDEYQRDVQGAADKLVNLRLQQYEQRRKRDEQLRNDVNKVERQYPELDKNSERFDPRLSEKVTKLYVDAGGPNSGVPLSEFVENIMEVRNSSRVEGQKEATQTLSRQNSESAVTPGTSSGDQRVGSDEQLSEAIKSGEISLEEAEKILPSS